MNTQKHQDYELRLEELEQQGNKDQPMQSGKTQAEQRFRQYVNGLPVESVLTQIANWFNSLTSAGKIAVVIIGGILGLSLLRTTLQLVASLFSLTILGVVLYLMYKFLINPQSQK
ncbi:MAG: hypothetical protein F6K14_19510 [Symploca sp. SIO2C1]|nr:hypothetical protein [Symploca sp. SIO2C1]